MSISRPLRPRFLSWEAFAEYADFEPFFMVKDPMETALSFNPSHMDFLDDEIEKIVMLKSKVLWNWLLCYELWDYKGIDNAVKKEELSKDELFFVNDIYNYRRRKILQSNLKDFIVEIVLSPNENVERATIDGKNYILMIRNRVNTAKNRSNSMRLEVKFKMIAASCIFENLTYVEPLGWCKKQSW